MSSTLAIAVAAPDGRQAISTDIPGRLDRLPWKPLSDARRHRARTRARSLSPPRRRSRCTLYAAQLLAAFDRKVLLCQIQPAARQWTLGELVVDKNQEKYSFWKAVRGTASGFFPSF
jgi:hypothetical protein